MKNKRKAYIDQIEKQIEDKLNIVTLKDLVKFKLKPIKTPYVSRESEEFYAIILPAVSLEPFDFKYNYRIMRCDKPSPIIQILPKKNVYSIDGNKIKEQKTEWEIEGSKGNKYIVRCNNGKYSCTCSGYKFRKTCKHVKDIKQAT